MQSGVVHARSCQSLPAEREQRSPSAAWRWGSRGAAGRSLHRHVDARQGGPDAEQWSRRQRPSRGTQ
eukprot:6389657-Pyramimonas_sp.AAC.2